DKVAVREDTGQVLHSGLLPVHLEKPITGLIENHDESRAGEADWDRARELVIAARLSQRLSTRLAAPRDQNFLPDDVSLQSLQQLVVADSRILGDRAGLAAIRRWVHGGGWLWVLLDRVDSQVLERILGDEFECTVVDRVGLTTVSIEKATDEHGNLPPGIEH